MTITNACEYISSEEQLSDFCRRASDRAWIVLDTEFIRERTYRPELCLIQIKSDELLAVVDTLVVKDLSALLLLLHDPAITKVFHAASQDLEIFYWLDKKVPSPVFDTQIAAPLLGFNEQIGYGNLVKEMLGVELSKAHTRADWTRRPMPENQLRYAVDDVIYLEQLYQKINNELIEKQRLDWLSPEFDALTSVDKYDKPARDMWKKMRSAQKLKNASLSVLQSLAEWRELQARESNLPRSWLIKDDVLTDLARQMPATEDELKHIRGLGKSVISKHASKLINVINESKQREPQPLPPFSRKKKSGPEQSAAVDVLSALVTLRAAELDINPVILAPRKVLEECVAQGNSEPIKGWRHPLIGNELEAALNGEVTIKIKDSKVITTQANP